MPPSRKPTSSHSSRPSRPSGGSHHSGYRRSSGGGFFSGMVLGSLLSQREQTQDRSTTVINQQIVTAPQPKMYECPYCLGKVTGTSSADGLSALTCPNCGGVLSEANAIAQPEMMQQTFSQPAQTYSSSPDTSIRAYPNQPSLGEKLKSCLFTVFGLSIVGLICGGIFWGCPAVRITATRSRDIMRIITRITRPAGKRTVSMWMCSAAPFTGITNTTCTTIRKRTATSS